MEADKKRMWIIVLVVLAALIGLLWSRYWSTQQLMKRLDSKSPAVARAAARELLARNVLEDSLPAQPVPRRVHAAAALGLVGSQAAFVQLAALIKDPEDKPQEAAARAFGRCGKAGIPYLLPVLKEGDDRAKKAAVMAFSLIGEPAVKPLTEALPDKDRREQAVKSLAQICIDRQIRAEQVSPLRAAQLLAVAELAVQPLLVAAQDPDKDLRTKAIEALGACREKRGVPYALQALADKDQRLVAIRALGLMADSRATMALVPYLKDEQLRIDAVTSLGEIGDVRGVPYLLQMLTDPEAQFQSRSVLALQRIGVPAAGLMAAALQHPNVYVRRAVAQGLAACQSAAANAALTASLKADSDYQVRAAAATALGWQGNTAAVPALIGALGDGKWQVAEAAVKALGRVGAGAVSPLIALFAGSSERAYLASAALVQMGESVSAPLVSALGSPNRLVRRWSAVTLGKLASLQAAPALRKMAQSADREESWVAQEALRQLRLQAAAGG